jgi:hypothetical protein
MGHHQLLAEVSSRSAQDTDERFRRYQGKVLIVEVLPQLVELWQHPGRVVGALESADHPPRMGRRMVVDRKPGHRVRVGATISGLDS